MLYNLLASGNDPFRKVGALEASLYALIGFVVVFVGITFLIFIVWGTGKIISAVEGKTSKAKPDKKVKPVEEAPAVSAKTAESEGELDEETVAVITAAIMAYYQTNNPKCEFTVKRIKRI